MAHIRTQAVDFITQWSRYPMSKAGKHSPKYQLVCGEQGTLFSYGSHFPLAKYEDGFILVNFQASTNTTNGHRSEVLSSVCEDKVIQCLDTLDEEGALKYMEASLMGRLTAAGKTRNKSILFSLAADPASLIGGSPVLKSYLGGKDLVKTVWSKAEAGSLLKRVAAVVLGKKAEFTGTSNALLQALYNKGCPEKFPGLKFLQHFHAVGAVVVATELASEDGGAALHIVID